MKIKYSGSSSSNTRPPPLLLFLLLLLAPLLTCGSSSSYASAYNGESGTGDYSINGEQPLSKIAIHKAVVALRDSSASISVQPPLLGLQGEDSQWVEVELQHPHPSQDDWVGVFSPARFNASTCYFENDTMEQMPYICSAPIKYMFANYSNSGYTKTGKASLKLQIINQRSDFSFALFSGRLSNPKLVAISTYVSFANPKAPLYPRLAQGKSRDEVILPSLKEMTWNMAYEETDVDSTDPVAVINLKLQGDSRSDSGEVDVKFQLAKETLETMLKSMYSIRDQLSDTGRDVRMFIKMIDSKAHTQLESWQVGAYIYSFCSSDQHIDTLNVGFPDLFEL